MKRKLLKFILHCLIILIMTASITDAQNSSGKCWYLDYDLWVEAEYPDIHGIIPNSSVFNPGNEMTMECWVRSYTFYNNMKVFGMTSPSFDNGYIMAFEEQHIYAEIFNPDNQSIPRTGVGPIPMDSAWVHLATTFSSTGEMINYLNGEEVGSTTVFPQTPVSESTEPFIIGRAPWDFSYAFNGDLDEIRIWNIQLSQSEIKQNMFRELNGNEPGLLAYYNFNSPLDEVFYDKTSNENNGSINNYAEDCFWWTNSFAPVGDSEMYTKHDIQGAWYGKSPAQYNYILTDNGLQIIANGIGEKEFRKYVVVGHNNLSGTTNENAPLNAPGDFLRTERSWYVNKAGNFKSQLVFNLEEAAAGGNQLTSDDDPIYYSLLYRSTEDEDFDAVYCANQVNGNYIIFDRYQFSDGFYAIGHSGEQLAQPTDILEPEISNPIKIFPIPTQKILNIQNAGNSKLTILTISGNIVRKTEILNNTEQINLSDFTPGVYIFHIQKDAKIINKKIIIQ